MRLSAPLLAVVGTTVGAAAAVAAYQAGASGTTEVSSSTQDKTSQTDVVAPTAAPRTKFLPCEKGTKLRKGACVRVKKKVVVVTDPAPAVPAGAIAAAQAPPAPEAASGASAGQPTGGRGRHESEQREHAAVQPRADREHAEERDHEGETEHGDEVEDHGDEVEDHAVEVEHEG